jgi:hypothetical protein
MRSAHWNRPAKRGPLSSYQEEMLILSVISRTLLSAAALFGAAALALYLSGQIDGGLF